MKHINSGHPLNASTTHSAERPSRARRAPLEFLVLIQTVVSWGMEAESFMFLGVKSDPVRWDGECIFLAQSPFNWPVVGGKF
jgi:hypothetical protein